MNPRKISRRSFVKDLTRTRHMTAVSAVVLGTTFMPLLGVPDMYELRTFQSAVESFSDARAHAFTPRRDDEAARERSSRSAVEDRDGERRGGSRGADRILTIERPEHQAAETLDTADILPLPPVEETELMAPVEEDEVALPEVAGEELQAPPPSEDDLLDEEKPPAEEEDEL